MTTKLPLRGSYAIIYTSPTGKEGKAMLSGDLHGGRTSLESFVRDILDHTDAVSVRVLCEFVRTPDQIAALRSEPTAGDTEGGE